MSRTRSEILSRDVATVKQIIGNGALSKCYALFCNSIQRARHIYGSRNSASQSYLVWETESLRYRCRGWEEEWIFHVGYDSEAVCWRELGLVFTSNTENLGYECEGKNEGVSFMVPVLWSLFRWNVTLSFFHFHFFNMKPTVEICLKAHNGSFNEEASSQLRAK